MNNKVQIDPREIDLVKLKKLIRYGDAKRISERTGYSHAYVLQVLSPNMERFVDAVVIAAVKLVNSRDKIEMDAQAASALTKNNGKSVRNSGNE